jgi:penicillin-binding protein 2
MTDFENNEDDVRDLNSRFKLVYAVIAGTLLLIFVRLWFLQIISGDELREYSEKNRVKENKIRAPRGLVLDREGRILVDNIIGFDATISPQYATELEDTADEVGRILGIEPAKIVEAVKVSRRKNGPFMPVVVKENLTLEEVFRLKRIRIDQPGLNVDETVLRFYPLDQNGAQLFGYVGEVSKKKLDDLNTKYPGKVTLQQGDIIGQSGLEEVWDQELRGRDGFSYIEVDAHGRESSTQNKAFLEIKPQPAVLGHNLVLTIDKDIQEAALKAMLEQKDKIGPRIGGLVAMKSNGEIIAWVNTPSFSPNRFARGITTDIWSQLINDPFTPLRNKIIQDPYAPGSSIKPIVALSALQENKITPERLVDSPPQMRFGNRFYHDSVKGGHGRINLYQAIEMSSNIFFYKLGIDLGIDNIAKYASLLGLGQKTGIELGNENSGVFPTKAWKLERKGEPWQPGENLSNAIGQGFVLVNLLQMAIAYNTIATGGKVVKPFILKQITDENQKVLKEFSPKIIRDVTQKNDEGTFIDPKNFVVVREAMRLVANGDRGTAHWWKIPGIEMAGKTGTSQVVAFSADDIFKDSDSRPFLQRPNGTYVAFAPFNNPEIVVGILAEHAGHGNMGGAPVVRDVMRAFFEKYHPEMIEKKGLSKAELKPAVVEESDE